MILKNGIIPALMKKCKLSIYMFRFDTMQKISLTPLSKEVTSKEKILRMKIKVSKLEL